MGAVRICLRHNVQGAFCEFSELVLYYKLLLYYQLNQLVYVNCIVFCFYNE